MARGLAMQCNAMRLASLKTPKLCQHVISLFFQIDVRFMLPVDFLCVGRGYQMFAAKLYTVNNK